MPFQIKTSQFCVTYPKCDGKPSELIEFLKRTFNAYEPLYILAVREKHADDTYHLHAAVKLGRIYRSRQQSFLDWNWDGSGSYNHPNIQSARRFSDWVKYCKKSISDASIDPSWVAEFGTLELNKSASEERITPEDLITKAKEMDLLSFMAFCSVNKYQMARDIWSMAHEDTTLTIQDGEVINGTVDKRFERLTAKVSIEQNKTLVIVGEAGIGKTTWAKKTLTKPLLFVSHLEDLRKFKPGFHQSILFDDVSITHLPITSQIHLVDTENPRSIHVRYGTIRMPAGVTKCFTCNSFPVCLEHPAIKRRTQLLLCFKDDLERFF